MPTCPLCDSQDLNAQVNDYGVVFYACQGCNALLSMEAATPGSPAAQFIRADVYGTAVNVSTDR